MLYLYPAGAARDVVKDTFIWQRRSRKLGLSSYWTYPHQKHLNGMQEATDSRGKPETFGGP